MGKADGNFEAASLPFRLCMQRNGFTLIMKLLATQEAFVMCPSFLASFCVKTYLFYLLLLRKSAWV